MNVERQVKLLNIIMLDGQSNINYDLKNIINLLTKREQEKSRNIGKMMKY